MCWYTFPKFVAFSLVLKKMKRKRTEFEYNLVDEFLKQKEKDTLEALKKIKEPTPKKPLLPKINVTKRYRKSYP